MCTIVKILKNKILIVPGPWEGDIERDRLLLLLLFNTKRMPSGPPSTRATITWMEV
jgi:hypothetical protein